MQGNSGLKVIDTGLIVSIRYNEKSISHSYCYRDEYNKENYLHWNFSCPMCIADSVITLNGLRKLCDSIRNNFGIDLTKDVKLDKKYPNKDISLLHYNYRLRRNTLTKNQLIKRAAACLFTVGIVTYKDGKYIVTLDEGDEETIKRTVNGKDVLIKTNRLIRKDKFFRVNNYISYGKERSFYQKICTNLLIINQKMVKFAKESGKLISSSCSKDYFKNKTLTANNMYFGRIFSSIAKLSKIIPEDEAYGILRALSDYKNSFKEQRKEIEDAKIKELVSNVTELFSSIMSGSNKDVATLISKIISVSNAKSLKKKAYKVAFIASLMSVLSSFIEKKIEDSPKVQNLEKRMGKVEHELEYWKQKYFKMKSKAKKHS